MAGEGPCLCPTDRPSLQAGSWLEILVAELSRPSSVLLQRPRTRPVPGRKAQLRWEPSGQRPAAPKPAAWSECVPGPPSPHPLLSWPLGAGGGGGLQGGRRGSSLTPGLSTGPASSDPNASGLKSSVESMALKQQMTLDAQRTSGLPQATGRTTVPRSVECSPAWGHSRPPVSQNPLCAGARLPQVGCPGGGHRRRVSTVKERHEQPLTQLVTEVNTPDPEAEIKGKQASEPFISSAKNTHLGRHVAQVPADKGGGHPWAPYTPRGEIQG